jgi:aldose 1-epimerase
MTQTLSPIDTSILHTIARSGGIELTMSNLGATLVALRVPDRRGEPGDILLGCDNDADYRAQTAYLGASIGPIANRIKGACVPLCGRSVQLDANENGNTLHSGRQGFDRQMWKWIHADAHSLKLQLITLPEPQGLPGRLTVQLEVSLPDERTADFKYTATTDRLTLLNLTHHPYFNLAPEQTGKNPRVAARVVGDHRLKLYADSYTPVDTENIPLGCFAPVSGTPFDFTESVRLADRWNDSHPDMVQAGGLDHNFVIKMPSSGTPTQLLPAAELSHPAGGRRLTVFSNQCGLQVYSGNFLNCLGKNGRRYGRRNGIALEPQAFPDSPHHPGFTDIRLHPEETYLNHIVYRFDTTK